MTPPKLERTDDIARSCVCCRLREFKGASQVMLGRRRTVYISTCPVQGKLLPSRAEQWRCAAWEWDGIGRPPEER